MAVQFKRINLMREATLNTPDAIAQVQQKIAQSEIAQAALNRALPPEVNRASSPQPTPVDSKVPDASVKPNMEVIAPSSTILGVSKPIFFAGVGVIACVAIGGGIWYYIKNKKQ
jgi:hypothetical protein